MYRALERMLLPDRINKKAASGAGFAVPTLAERTLSTEEGPYLVSNMRSKFLVGKRSEQGAVRFAFSQIPLEKDDSMLVPLHDALLALKPNQPRCSTISAAMARIRASGMEPRTIVVPQSWLPEWGVSPEEVLTAREIMGKQGYVTKVDDMQVLVADIPISKAFVAASPTLTGIYTRCSDYLGVLIYRADRSIVAVSRDLGG